MFRSIEQNCAGIIFHMILELGISGMTWSWEIFLVEISFQKLLIPSLSAQEGVQFVCSNLSPSVTRLCLASCGMSVTGAAAVAKMLRSAMVARCGKGTRYERIY